jgi:hypothetical protein
LTNRSAVSIRNSRPAEFHVLNRGVFSCDNPNRFALCALTLGFDPGSCATNSPNRQLIRRPTADVAAILARGIDFNFVAS